MPSNSGIYLFPWFIGGAFIFILSCGLTALYQVLAKRWGIMDIPNARSLHTMPIPRGGGIVIALIIIFAALILSLSQIIEAKIGWALIGSGIAVTIVSFYDDVKKGGLSWRVRLFIQAVAAIWGIIWLGGIPVLPLGPWVFPLGWMGYILGAFALVWMANLYNFMDGIDGSAASEAIFVGGAYAILAAWGGSWGLAVVGVLVALAAAGFLVWNWFPAKIFMGDAGAVFLGLVFGLLTIAAGQTPQLSPWPCVILLGVYICDATVTLLTRAYEGERLYEAHNTFAFQRLAKRWGHKKTTLFLASVNIVWLFPLATIAHLLPFWAPALVVLAFIPLITLALKLKAGRVQGS